ncbi:MAG: glycosyltransferase [Ignavibacteria bacterium]|nr:glycosyltransferase [Ignavibacteria bacterium]
MNNKSILHIAQENFAGMPYEFVKTHRKYGCNSRLVTMYQPSLGFEGDINLNLKLTSGKFSSFYRKKTQDAEIQKQVQNYISTAIFPSEKLQDKKNKIKYYRELSFFEQMYFWYRDFKNSIVIEEAINKYSLYKFDIYHFDGGMDLYRDFRFLKELKSKGKKIIACYFGSDLRTRGIFREMDELSDLNLTVEFDHLSLHPDIHFTYFPFECCNTSAKKCFNKKLKIVHSPTNRFYKGTDKIIGVIEKIKKDYDFEFVLLENMNHDEVLRIKRDCDLAIDQVGGIAGGSGYGRNSIENLAMGIPTISEFSDDYLKFIGDNPFINSNIKKLGDVIADIIRNPDRLIDISQKGIEWLERTHSYKAVNERLTSIYKEKEII